MRRQIDAKVSTDLVDKPVHEFIHGFLQDFRIESLSLSKIAWQRPFVVAGHNGEVIRMRVRDNEPTAGYGPDCPGSTAVRIAQLLRGERGRTSLKVVTQARDNQYIHEVGLAIRIDEGKVLKMFIDLGNEDK